MDSQTCPHDGTPTLDETLLRETADPLLGSVLAGRFRLLEPLGRGGMGRVYLADQVTMKRRVAVKVIRTDAVSDAYLRMDLARRFHREALAASRLVHPNTVRVFDYGQSDEGLLFIAMELLVGPTLAKLLAREKRLSPARAVRVAVQASRSLSEAHQQGIVHRDLKPDNIILTDVAGESDFVKILDFGIAKVALPGSLETELTRSGIVMGTPTYMAPEQGRGEKVGPGTDLYSLGVILYHCLAGRVPFTGDTPLALMMQHAQAPVPPLVVEGFPPDVPPALEGLVRALLGKSPEHRPGPALEVARLLEASLPASAPTILATSPPCLIDPICVATAPLPTRRSPDADDVRPSNRQMAWWVGMGMVLIVAVVALGALLWSGQPPEPVASAGARANPDLGAQVAVSDATSPAALPGMVAAPNGEASSDAGPDPQSAETGVHPPVIAPSTKVSSFGTRPTGSAARPPRCTSLRCPFTQQCLAPDGRRTIGEDYCLPVFR